MDKTIDACKTLVVAEISLLAKSLALIYRLLSDRYRRTSFDICYAGRVTLSYEFSEVGLARQSSLISGFADVQTTSDFCGE